MCEHHWQAESATNPDAAGRSLVTFSCTKCGETLNRLTTRTAKQIQAELDAQPTP
jgi:transposase-like protein